MFEFALGMGTLELLGVEGSIGGRGVDTPGRAKMGVLLLREIEMEFVLRTIWA